MRLTRRAVLLSTLALTAACGRRQPPPSRAYSGETPEMDRLIARASVRHGVPESLIHRVVRRESGYNPAARHGPYYGLMQILPQTARTMGYHGPDAGLLDAETNLEYGTRYLRGAWIVANRDPDRAVMWYAKGYYYEAKRRGLLQETGLA